jgi:hypothetical protein
MYIVESTNLSQIKDALDIFKGIASIAGVLVASLWAWSRFVLERGLMPPSEMRIRVRRLGGNGSGIIVQAEIRILNKGSSALIVDNLRIRLRHIQRGDSLTVLSDQNKSTFGHLEFPHASVAGVPLVPERTQLERISEQKMAKSMGKRKPREYKLGTGEFLVVPHDTFVLPGVTQMYAFVTCLPEATDYVLAKASFNYEIRPTMVQLGLLRLSRELGMLQYSLDHVKKPHTIESAFKLSD